MLRRIMGRKTNSKTSTSGKHVHIVGYMSDGCGGSPVHATVEDVKSYGQEADWHKFCPGCGKRVGRIIKKLLPLAEKARRKELVAAIRKLSPGERKFFKKIEKVASKKTPWLKLTAADKFPYGLGDAR